jgi:hypothetical protein
MDSLKVLDPDGPIREVDMVNTPRRAMFSDGSNDHQ